jgi:hypothetical protein
MENNKTELSVLLKDWQPMQSPSVGHALQMPQISLLRKKDKLKTGFLDKQIGEMPIGGISFSVKALKESAKAKYKTGNRNFIFVFLFFIFFWVLLKTYQFRRL